MRKLFCMIAFSLCVSMAGAKSMPEIWAAMPDSLLPYVDHNHRLEMTEFIGMGLKGDVDNLFNGKSTMDTITSDYIHVTLNESAELHVKRLATAGDSILCVVRTWKGPKAESCALLYDEDWHLIGPAIHQADSVKRSLQQKPDTMTVDAYAKLMSKMDFCLLSATLSPVDDALRLNLSIPTDNKDDKAAFAPLEKQISLKWDGENYK